MSTYKRVTFFLFVLLNSMHFLAQEKDIVFEQITNESGRSLGFITGIVQDQTGFMWFATRNGLYRYNGYSYKLFRNNPKDSLSLPFNNITSLYYDNNSVLWIRHMNELAAFKNEKRCFDFDSITKRSYDLEVKIVQDKKGNYWIGPTGNGVAMYSPENNVITDFTCPQKTYSPKAWRILDSLLIATEIKAQIGNPENSTDTLIDFEINESGTYLIASSGEFDKSDIYDFGTLQKDGKVIWELNKELAMWTGGEEKNYFEASVINLDSGKYSLTFKSDISHCCNNWDGKAPTKIDFCGISLNLIEKNDINVLESGLLNSYENNSHIFSDKVKDIIVDNAGDLWALTDQGLEKYNYKKQKFVHFPINFEELLGTSVEKESLRLFQDKSGVFWIGSMYGLIKYDNLWGKFVVFQNSSDYQVLTSNFVYSVFEDKYNQIWIGTDKGLNIYDRERNTIMKITANNHNRLYNNKIYQMFEDNGGNLWIATAEGLNRLIKNNFIYTDLNIEADHTFPAVYDESGNIWYGVDNKIQKYSRTYTTIEEFVIPDKYFNKNDFTGVADYSINDLIKTQDQNIWFASNNKFNRLNVFTKKIDYSFSTYAVIVNNDSIKNNAKKIIEGVNTIYAFCLNGFYELNAKDLTQEGFYSYNFAIDFIDEFDINFFKTALRDKKGNLWIRTSDGIYYFDSQLKSLDLLYEFDSEIKFGPLSDGEMDFDKFGNLWFATLPYVNKISAESHKLERWQCEFEHEWGTANTKVGSNTIWNYGSNGLYSFNINNEQFIYYSIENGFVDNNINGLEEDNLGYVWLTSLKGLIKLDTLENTSKNFFTSSDFTTRHFLGNPPNFDINTGEKILFTIDGFVSFYPDSINNNVPKIVLDKFTMRGKDFSLDSLIQQKKHIKLKYNQNFLGFEFSALDFTDPAQNKYKYRLDGLEDDWVLTDATNRRANYSGISPGNYTLYVMGSNNDKVWNEKGLAIKITITPPWYKTIAAYIFYIISVTIAIWLFIKVREKQLIEEKRQLEQKVRERTAEIAAKNEELETQNEMIAEQHKNITDSIHYAQRIQKAILPHVESLHEVLDDFFILYRPRDIVSGDYYWTTRQNNITIIVAADCTGHGVPGAFMSMLGIAFLNEIVNKELIVEPNLILNRLREQIIIQLHQCGEDGESKDGMDVSLYVINHETMQLSFAGAYNGLFIIRDGELNQLKADRMPIGYHIKKDVPFTKQNFELKKGDCLYNSSDGYPDQFGGPDGRKYMTKRFKELLLKIHQKPMDEQREILNKEFDDWRGCTEPIDDVIVIGVRI
ncbi:MAG: SpoIIE family protein phosphatase [Salinivirgaceae bacterium]|nr:SpoIIE family protein phosphatase [Salinivirgaceae bacterium]